MANNANFVATPNIGISQISTANTNRDGTGTIATVFTAGANGSRIDAINLKAVDITTAGMVRLYVSDGSNIRLLSEVPVVAVTPSATSPAWEAQLNTNTTSQILPLVLSTGYSLRASTHNANTFNVITVGGNF